MKQNQQPLKRYHDQSWEMYEMHSEFLVDDYKVFYFMWNFVLGLSSHVFSGLCELSPGLPYMCSRSRTKLMKISLQHCSVFSTWKLENMFSYFSWKIGNNL